MRDYFLTELLGIQGWYVKDKEITEENGQQKVILDIEREGSTHVCSRCGGVFEQAYQWRQQEVRHLLLWEHPTYLRFTKYRVKCPRCGLRAERLPWLSFYGRVTQKLDRLVYELCKVLTVQAISILLFLHKDTIKGIDKKAIRQAHNSRPLDGITVLGVDEIAIGKGHKYWHIIHALDGPRGPEVIHIGEGRKEKDLEPFWKKFGKRRAERITHAVMDMWKGFERSFNAHCPSVTVIYDKFHIMRHLLNALNEVRKAEFRRARKKMRDLLCGKRFILLSRVANLSRDARKTLKDLLRVNKRLYKAHLLKENFGQFWSYGSKKWALRFWEQWKRQLKWSRLEPYKRFTKMIDRHIEGILACCDKRVPFGYIEATNLKARNIIRRAYGYRDKEYMQLKIIQGCSSLGVFEPWSFFNNSS